MHEHPTGPAGAHRLHARAAQRLPAERLTRAPRLRLACRAPTCPFARPAPYRMPARPPDRLAPCTPACCVRAPCRCYSGYIAIQHCPTSVTIQSIVLRYNFPQPASCNTTLQYNFPFWLQYNPAHFSLMSQYNIYLAI